MKLFQVKFLKEASFLIVGNTIYINSDAVMGPEFGSLVNPFSNQRAFYVTTLPLDHPDLKT